MKGITRRRFLQQAGLAAGAGLLAACEATPPPAPAGALGGPDARIGHRLREGNFPPPVREARTPVLIAGAGIAGLSCAWWLRRNGFADFRLLELDDRAGGNARSGHNAVSAYPLGAHYLPLPGVEATYVRLLLADLGVLRGDPAAAAPAYDERLLVQAPEERLFIHGRWQEGLVPQFGLGASTLREIDRFQRLMDEWTQRRGRDGRPAFAVPMALSSQDPALRALDTTTFHDWLLQQGFRDPALHWYVRYGCRDDYGTDPRRLSAWAGLHYFCSRRGAAANAEANSVLTAPEGNGWFVQQLAARVQPQLHARQAVVRVHADGRGVAADVYDAARDEVVRWHCEQLVWAAPLAVLARAWSAARALPLPDYAPWVVANLTLQGIDEREYTTWDNVIYQGRGLGYVDATHQSLRFRRPDRVLTWYHVLSDADPREGRRALHRLPRTHWTGMAFADLRRAHPRLEAHCRRADVWRWPHAMAMPVTGFLGQLPARARPLHPRVRVAHADLSGFSLFEEAQYHGVEAARALLDRLG